MCPCMPAIVLYHCIFQGAVRVKISYLFFVFMYYFHKKYHKSITVQHYIAQLVGYVVGLMNKLHL